MGESSALEGTPPDAADYSRTRCRGGVRSSPGCHGGRRSAMAGGGRPCQAHLLCPAISANARFVGFSTNNVTVTASLATVHKTNG